MKQCEFSENIAGRLIRPGSLAVRVAAPDKEAIQHGSDAQRPDDRRQDATDHRDPATRASAVIPNGRSRRFPARTLACPGLKLDARNFLVGVQHMPGSPCPELGLRELARLGEFGTRGVRRPSC